VLPTLAPRVRVPVLAVALVASALALTGCTASVTKPAEEYSGEPKGVEAPASSAGGAAWAVWMKNGEQIAIVLYGSSSCPPKVATIGVTSSTQVKATLAPAPGGICTRDYVPHTTIFPTPSAVKTTKDVSVLLPDATLTLPALPG
jgi:hypothetical protein